jgi:riboflavin synthase alpha subunit
MLQYIWKAYYKDGTDLHQFNAEGKEVLFKEIDQTKLKYFAINSKDKDHFVLVNLENGNIVIDGISLFVDELDNKNELYRLIYFRRVSKNMSTNGITVKEESTTIKYFIGFQITLDSVNKQVMIEVDDKHNFKLYKK